MARDFDMKNRLHNLNKLSTKEGKINLIYDYTKA